MQFYLLKPLWKLTVTKVPFYIAIPISALLTVFMYKFDVLLSYLGIFFEHRSRLFVTYIVFWVIGIYFGHYYDKIKESIIKHKTYIYISIIPIIFIAFLLWWQF
jgi:hypothetical protein